MECDYTSSLEEEDEAEEGFSSDSISLVSSGDVSVSDFEIDSADSAAAVRQPVPSPALARQGDSNLATGGCQPDQQAEQAVNEEVAAAATLPPRTQLQPLASPRMPPWTQLEARSHVFKC